jgi:cytochrome c oxidase subunit 4
MHLKWDNKFNALIFISTLFFIGVFFAYTMNDTEKRGELDPDQNVKVWEKNGEQAPGGMVKPEGHEAAPAAGGAAGHGQENVAPDPHGAAPAPAHH